jgi:hypothetical protein
VGRTLRPVGRTRLSGRPDALTGSRALRVGAQFAKATGTMLRPPVATLRSRLARAGFRIALGSALLACGHARGPPLAGTANSALERAYRALRTDGGVEAPRALVAALAADPICPGADLVARVCCHLARRSNEIALWRLADGYRLRIVMPHLSDHVHLVRVPHRGHAEVDSEN